MPPKARQGRVKDNMKMKADIAEKVREIKLRQDNWMKQRQSTIISPSVKPKRPASSDDSKTQVHGRNMQDMQPAGKSSKQRPFSGSHIQPKMKTSSQFAKHDSLIETPMQYRSSENDRSINTQFHNWVKNKAETQVDTQAETNENDCDLKNVDNPDHKHTGLPEKSKVIDNCDSKEYNRSRNTDSSQPGQPLPPEMFDTLADQIVNRVKTELNLSRRNQSKSHVKDYSAIKYEEKEDMEETGPLNKSGHGFESHYCPHCSKLMLPPTRSPMLVIPCGHTFCEMCIEGESQCLGCGKAINSLTGNIMLQQIIMDFKTRKKSDISNTDQNMAHASQDSQFRSVKKKQTAADYEEEYKTLTMRCEVLDAEADSIKEQVEHINRKIDSEHKQIKHISREEERLALEIKSLEGRLCELRQHREDYNSRCEELEEQREEQRSRLGLVRDTLRQLQQDREKVRQLAEH